MVRCGFITDKYSIRLIEAFYNHENQLLLFVFACSFSQCKAMNGEPLVKESNLQVFSNTEEEAVKLTKVVPLLEDELVKNGAHYSK
jgi:hypothetical protein